MHPKYLDEKTTVRSGRIIGADIGCDKEKFGIKRKIDMIALKLNIDYTKYIQDLKELVNYTNMFSHLFFSRKYNV